MGDADSVIPQTGVDGLLPEQEVSIKLSRARLNDMDETKAMAKEVRDFGQGDLPGRKRNHLRF
jgi:hypothetical protein